MRKRKLTKPAIIIMSVFLLSVSVRALDLAEYRAKIQTVKNDLEYLSSHGESETEADIRAEEQESLRNIRATLQPTETVELQNARVETDYEWLFVKLKNFETEPDLKKRTAIVEETVARLQSIEYKLDELAQQTALERTKDSDKQKLEEILRRAEYRKPEEKDKNFLQKAWRDFWKWLDELFPEPSTTTKNETGAQSLSFVLQLLIFGAVFAVIGFLFYRFAPFLRQKFAGRKKSARSERIILGETLAADETSQNLFSEAERLAREGDLRAAIRKGYIALLCELHDRKIIGLANHKTNRDYLRDVRRRPALHRNMNILTSNFERVWYGFGEAETRDWESFREKYRQTMSEEK